MHSTIGFLNERIEMDHLERKEEKLTTKEKDNINEPVNEDNIEEHKDSDEYEGEEINASDIMLYSTRNTEELSYLEFHIIDKLQDIEDSNSSAKESDFFIHHDIFITETIVSSAYFTINKSNKIKHYVAMSGFSNDIVVYDALVYNPLLPSFTLKGHENTVNKILLLENNQNTELVSGSDDCSLIYWDLECGKIKSKEKYGNLINKIAMNMEDNNRKVFVADKTSLYFDNQLFYNSDDEIEVIKTKENDLFVGNEKGYLNIFDIRNLKSGVKKNKMLHKDSLTDFDFYKDKIISVGLDGQIIILNDKLEIIRKESNKEELFCVCVNEKEDICVYGGVFENLRLFNLE